MATEYLIKKGHRRIACIQGLPDASTNRDRVAGFRDALKNLERQAAYDQIVRACTSEQGALANTDIPAMLDAMLLTASVDNRSLIEQLSKRLDSLEEQVRMLKPGE